MFRRVALILAVTSAVGIVEAQTREKPLVVGGSVAPPKLVSATSAVLPPNVSVDRDPIIVVSVLIGPNGDVAEASALTPQPGADAAVAAVKQWKYQPTVVDEKAVWVRLVATVHVQRRATAVSSPTDAVGSPGPIETASVIEGAVQMSSGTAHDGQHWLTLLSIEASGKEYAYLITHAPANRPDVKFVGRGRIAVSPGRLELTSAVDSAGWEFSSLAAPAAKISSSRAIHLDVVGISDVPVTGHVSHETIRATFVHGDAIVRH